MSVPFNHHTKDYVHNIVKSSNFFRKPYIHVTGSSKTVVLSDSLLSHLWTHEEIKLFQVPTFHVLIGGKVGELAKIVRNIGDEVENIIVAAGINNVSSQSSKEIIDEMTKLTKLLYKQNLVICSLPYPPKFCEKNGMLEQNMIDKITCVNKFIKSYNMNNCQVSVDLHKYGSEFVNQKLKFKYNEWKEVEKWKKLHFSWQVKKKIAVEISKISFHTTSKKNIKLEIGNSSLPLFNDFMPKITAISCPVKTIPGLIFKEEVKQEKRCIRSNVSVRNDLLHKCKNEVTYILHLIFIFNLYLILGI